MLNTAINAAVMGSEVIEGAKKAKGAWKNTTPNVHDVILKNKPTVIPSESVTNKSASDEIDILFKAAAEEDEEPSGKEIKRHDLLPKAIAAAILAAGISSAVSSRNPLAPFRELGQAAKTVPGIVGDKFLFKGRVGKVLKKGFNLAKEKVKGKRVPGDDEMYFAQKIRPKELADQQARNSQRFMRGAVLGGGIGAGNLGIHMIGDRYFSNKHSVQKSYDSIPEPVSEIYHARLKDKEMNKASNMIDDAFEKLAAMPSFTGGKHFLKKVLKEDVAQNALRSLPYLAIPAAASYAVGRDLRYDARKISRSGNDKIVIDVPLRDFKKNDSLEKKAGIKDLFKKKVLAPVHESPSWKHFFKYEMPAATARSLSFALPATALTALTGRNIRGSGEKINQADRKPVEHGKARITIETGNNHRTPEMDSKSASENIESFFKTAIAVSVKKKRKTDIRTRVKQFMIEKRLTLMQNSDILKNIVRAAMDNKTVNIQYRDAKGVISTRETEPYEMRDNKYWGYCKDKGSIRQFNMENVMSATVTDNKYSPRWEVKIK